jgi:hypothetical protein
MTTLGKLFVVSQFILSLVFAVIAGLFLAHRLPWNPPTSGGGTQATLGMIERHEKKIKDLAVGRDRADARWNAYHAGLVMLEAERPQRKALFDAKLALARTGKGATPPVTAVEYNPPNIPYLATGRVKDVGAAPIQYRSRDVMAFDPLVAELRRMHRNEVVNNVPMLGPIPETQQNIDKLLKEYNELTVAIQGQGAVRGLRREIALQEEAKKNAVEQQEYLKPFLANRYSETVLLLQRQNSLLSRKQELQKIGVAAGTVP